MAKDREKLNIEAKGKMFYYPNGIPEYDLIWKEFVQLSAKETSGKNPKFYKAHANRAYGYVIKKLIYGWVYNRTKNQSIRDSIMKIQKGEEEKNIINYNIAIERGNVRI